MEEKNEEKQYFRVLDEAAAQKVLSYWEERAKECLDLYKGYYKEWQQLSACMDFFIEASEIALFLGEDGVAIVEDIGLHHLFRSPNLEEIIRDFEREHTPKNYEEIQNFTIEWMKSKAGEDYAPFKEVEERCKEKNINYVIALSIAGILLRDNYLVSYKFGEEERAE